MPQLTLEYSSNIFEKNNFAELFQQCHTVLAEMLPTEIFSCKSRAIECNNFFIGSGEKNNAFIHITLAVMLGRSSDTLEKTANSIMQILKAFFINSLQTLNLQITLELRELSKVFLKVTS